MIDRKRHREGYAMRRDRNQNHPRRRQALAALWVPLMLAASGPAQARDGGQDGAAPGTGAEQHRSPGRAQLYSIINLAPDVVGTFLNERGQAAFSSLVYRSNSFFDGDRIHALRSLDYTLIRGLNNRGTVVGLTEDGARPLSHLRSFTWTRTGGTRLLPVFGAEAFGVNDRNQVVGRVPETNTSGRAVRWDPDGRVRALGPRPPSQSNARDINNDGLAGGFADVAGGAVHAMLWDRAGRQIELGSLGGAYASADLVNERGQAAGQAFDAANRALGFFWSARSGLVPLVPQRAGYLYISDLNDRGDIAGIVQVPGPIVRDYVAFRWSLARGFEWLAPAGPGIITDVLDLNNRNQMVGSLQLPGGEQRAVRWDGGAHPIDLNTRLYRPPAGLVLYAGRAINDAGTILAFSSAGLVMLRPGTRGTDAPVLGPISGVPNRVLVGQEIRGTVGFVDNAPNQTHSAAVSWDDNCTSPHPAVREAGGVGQVVFQHRFCAAGYYRVRVRVSDSGGRTTEVARYYDVADPALPAISGQGSLTAAPGPAPRAGPGTPALRFMLWAPLPGPAAASAAGRAQLTLAGPFQFVGDRVATLSRQGDVVRMEGTGRYNGRAGYRFLAEASDGDRPGIAGRDRLRIRVTHTEPGGVEMVDYDNAAMASEAVPESSSAPDRSLLTEGGLDLNE